MWGIRDRGQGQAHVYKHWQISACIETRRNDNQRCFTTEPYVIYRVFEKTDCAKSRIF